jgi:aminopeptidase N
VFEGIGERPVLSINRDFSAPVIVDANRSRADLALLSARDDNPFARYEATQQLMLDTLIAAIGGAPSDPGPVIEAVRATLCSDELDAAFMAEAVSLPNEALIGDQMDKVDPEAIHAARASLLIGLGRELEAQWRGLYEAAARTDSFQLSPAAKGARRLRTVALSYLVEAGGEEACELAFAQFAQANNMTDRQGALRVLADSDAPQRTQALAMFYDRYRSDALVIDKWFAAQALSYRDDTPAIVERLAHHPDFTLANPNRLRALVGSFTANQRAFHDASGRGYRFLADMILAVERLNPQSAAKLVPPLGRWRRFDERRAALMKEQLERIAGTEKLSKDVYEQVSKSLA